MPTFVWTWFTQDIIVFLMAIATIVFIIKKEKNPIPILLEFVCFVILYASVYENLATIMGWYGYGRSSIMIFNVPISVPIIEYLVLYTGIRLGKKMGLSVWMLPFFVGFLGTLFDFSLDPLSVSQRYDTLEGTIGRWTWFVPSEDISIFNIPVYNFTGWFILSGYATVFILLGRFWLSKAKRPNLVGYLYPALAMIASLLVLVSPISNFLLWLGPFFQKGSWAEVVALACAFLIFAGIMVYYFAKKKREASLTFHDEWLIMLVLGGSHIFDILFTIIGGYWDILPLVAGESIAVIALLLAIFLGKPRQTDTKKAP